MELAPRGAWDDALGLSCETRRLQADVRQPPGRDVPEPRAAPCRGAAPFARGGRAPRPGRGQHAVPAAGDTRVRVYTHPYTGVCGYRNTPSWKRRVYGAA